MKRDPNGGVILDEKGEATIADESSGIQFLLSDGFSIHIDFTAIWGLMPEQAPHAIKPSVTWKLSRIKSSYRRSNQSAVLTVLATRLSKLLGW
ncbi:MAG: hypothetical protein R3C11_28420 [Planctomycetaceae bacterium]